MIKKYRLLFASLVITLGMGFLGSLAMPDLNGWYVELIKPALQPPNWIFGPVWTVLYIFMGIALYRIWRLAHYRGDASLWTLVFLLHLVLNGAWSVLFFYFQNPSSALIDIAILWILLVYLLVRGWWIDRTAGWLLLPYVMWVTFATYLNLGIVLLN